MLENVTFRTFKSLKDVSVDLGLVNVFIGANGSGKSNLLEALGVLSAAADGKVDDRSLLARGNWECHDDPGAQFSALPKARRLSKRKPDYERRENDIGNGWPIVASKLTEARRFKDEFLAAVG